MDSLNKLKEITDLAKHLDEKDKLILCSFLCLSGDTKINTSANIISFLNAQFAAANAINKNAESDLVYSETLEHLDRFHSFVKEKMSHQHTKDLLISVFSILAELDEKTH